MCDIGGQVVLKAAVLEGADSWDINGWEETVNLVSQGLEE